MSSYLVSELLLMLFFILWGFARHDLTEERNYIKSLQNQLTDLEAKNKRICEEINELKEQKTNDLISAIYNRVLYDYPEFDTNELMETIIENLHYVDDISCVEDLFKYDFDYIVKVALHAKDGLLDVYYNYGLSEDTPFRIGADGYRIFLSEEEVEKMANRDYSFIFDAS